MVSEGEGVVSEYGGVSSEGGGVDSEWGELPVSRAHLNGWQKGGPRN